ncbi:MAG: VWA domain-containing protein [Gammaproteobacteria bacterium]|nr:VWA domain-containing protein [Gammaproteobacteria bacterium]
MSDNKKLPQKSSSADVGAFLSQVRAAPVPRNNGQKGRLIFALDATASREPSWDHASQLQAKMFSETAALGGLEIQLCYYRGFGEFHASPWINDTRKLLQQMSAVRCLGGHTQINTLLKHAIAEARKGSAKVNALVFIGDCVEESVDQLTHSAGQLGLLGVPVFLFHEGVDATAASAFQQIARLSGGAYCSFDAASAQHLRDLLSAVAVFAAGGQRALNDFHQRHGRVLLTLTRRK